MSFYATLIALYTLLRRECVRMLRIWIQAFLGPITSIFLYFLIFGNIIGQRIGLINGIPYLFYIAPGLILIALISTAYSHVSSSFFITRFQRNIEEIIVTPISHFILLLSFVISGIIRGLLVASILGLMLSLIFKLPLHLTPSVIFDASLTAAIFALIGFSNGYYAKDFDEIAFIPSFILTPLSYLAGVFYSLDMLSPTWHHISSYNPLVYIIQTFRAATLEIDYSLTFETQELMLLSIVLLFIFNLRIMRQGMLLKK